MSPLAQTVPDDVYSARKDLDDEDMIQVLERCYSVIHGRRTSSVSASSFLTTSSQTVQNNILGKHMRRYNFDTVKLRLTKLDHHLYDLIWPSVKKLPADANFRVALEQDFPLGVVVPDYCCYKVFREFLEPIIKEYNALDINAELPPHPESKFTNKVDENDVGVVDVDLDLDPPAKSILSGN